MEEWSVSEEEDELSSWQLEKMVLYKFWVICSLTTGNRDVAYHISRLLRSVHYNDVTFLHMWDDACWYRVTETMSAKRRDIQYEKERYSLPYQTVHDRVSTNEKVYTQVHMCVKTTYISLNKTMWLYMVPAHRYHKCVIKKMLKDIPTLRAYTKCITYMDEPYSTLVLVMDTGINREKAIQFALSLDRHNSFNVPNSKRLYHEEYCSVCHVRACNEQYTGFHGCDCQQSLICVKEEDYELECSCDCHCTCLLVQKLH